MSLLVEPRIGLSFGDASGVGGAFVVPKTIPLLWGRLGLDDGGVVIRSGHDALLGGYVVGEVGVGGSAGPCREFSGSHRDCLRSGVGAPINWLRLKMRESFSFMISEGNRVARGSVGEGIGGSGDNGGGISLKTAARLSRGESEGERLFPLVCFTPTSSRAAMRAAVGRRKDGAGKVCSISWVTGLTGSAYSGAVAAVVFRLAEKSRSRRSRPLAMAGGRSVQSLVFGVDDGVL
jgi:hypothetical protein